MVKFKCFGFPILLILLSSHTSANDPNIMKIDNVISNSTMTDEMLKVNMINEEIITPDIGTLKSVLHTINNKICREDLMITLQALDNRNVWAMQMFDSSMKYPEGLLFGQSYQLGNFDECISVEEFIKTENNHDHYIKGQYCLVDTETRKNYFVPTNKNHTLRKRVDKIVHSAVCVPSSCTPNDVQLYIEELLKLVFTHKELRVDVPELNCYFKNEKEFSTSEIVYGSLICVFILFIISATIYHSIHIYKKTNCSNYSLDRRRKPYSTSHETMVAFSLLRNIGKIIEVKNKNNDFNLDCICGIRTISMLFILAGHALIFTIGGPIMNLNFYEMVVIKTQNAVFLNNPLLVDSFLLMSGFLMCRLLLLELEKRNGKINFLILYIARYIRLTPAYLVVLGFYCTFFLRINNGPLWNQRVTLEQDRCIESWWANLLYINNYANTDHLYEVVICEGATDLDDIFKLQKRAVRILTGLKYLDSCIGIFKQNNLLMCMFQSWYLSVDTQLFMLSPLIIYPLWKKRRLGEFILGIATLTTITIPFIVTYVQQLDPTLMVYIPEIVDISTNSYFINAYIKTHMRASGYVIGLLFGYLVHRIQSSALKVPFRFRILGWIIAGILGLSSLFTVVIFYDHDHEYNELEAALYSPLHRISWCLAVGWTILICVTQNSGIINKFLCWKPFTVFSKLTYCAYLINGVIEIYSYGNLRAPRFLSVYNLFMETAAHIMITFFAAFVLCILFEAPIHSIEKILLRKERKQKNPSASTQEFVESC